jgi:hypothetical protein
MRPALVRRAHGICPFGQVALDRGGVEGRRHHDDLQVGPGAALEGAQEGEAEVAVEVALVELVEDDDADRAQRGVGVQLAGEQALGDEAQAGVGAGGGLEADLVADARPMRARRGCRRRAG